MDPRHFRKKHDKASGKLHRAIANRHLALSAKILTGTQRRTMMFATYVAAAVGIKASLGMKQSQAVKKSTFIIALSIVVTLG